MKRLILLFCLLAFAQTSFAAISAAAVWNFDTASTGTAGKNGGFFVTGASGSDLSGAGAQVALTIASSAGAGNVVTHASAAATWVGNGVFVVSGTNFTLNAWFEITSVVVGVSFTCSTNAAGASISTGVGVADGVMNIGGSNNLNSTLADDIFEAGAPGNIYYIKSGAYTPGEAISIALAGGASNPISIRGYTTTQGDTCTSTNRPTIACGANNFTIGLVWTLFNLIFTSTGSTGVTATGGNVLKNCKVTNLSTTANRVAISSDTDTFIVDCEAVSYRGRAINSGTLTGVVTGSYIHDSDIGITNSGTTTVVAYQNNIIESCVTAAISFTGAHVGRVFISGNTLFGSTGKTGTGITMVTGCTDIAVINNIITGFVTGVSHADTQSVGYDNYNNYYNNTADVSAAGQWQKGPNDTAVAPSFTSVSQVTGATATTSGSVLTQAGADFTASGVVAGRDFLYLISGTGITAGVYGVTAVGTTTITLDIAPGTSATADKVFQITTGRNFYPGAALKSLGFPGAFQGGYTTGYMSPGAVQFNAAGGGGQSSSASVK